MDPIDVELPPVSRSTRLVVADQILEHFLGRGAGIRQRHSEVANRPVELVGIQAGGRLAIRSARAINLLHKFAVFLHQSRVERILVVEVLKVGHGHAFVQIVAAGGERIFAIFRILDGKRGLKVRIKIGRRRSSSSFWSFTCVPRAARFFNAWTGGRRQFFRREFWKGTSAR